MSTVKLLITGSRSYPSPGLIKTMLTGAWHACRKAGDQLLVIHGAAPDGVDFFAHDTVGLLQELEPFGVIDRLAVPADWDGPCDLSSGICQPGHRKKSRFGSSPDYCPTAGHRRNQVMVDMKPDRWWAFTDRPLPLSKGTADCVARCKDARIQGNHMELWTP